MENLAKFTENIGINLPEHFLRAYRLMCYVQFMAATYDDNRQICKYVHSTSRGHEAIQIAVGMQLQSTDCASPYYRDEAMLLAMGWSPYDLMLQLLAKADDPFSGGRSYYSHPANKGNGKPLIPHQSSATGMQIIPATGMAQGIKYIESQQLKSNDSLHPLVLCSIGDGAMTEGEVSEALQFAVLKQLPIIYLVQDNEWGISVSSKEARAMDAYEYAAGFKGLKRLRVDGSDFKQSWTAVEECIAFVRNQRKPILLHAKVPLLGHHTSGVRKEWYRSEEDLLLHSKSDPFIKMEHFLLEEGLSKDQLDHIKAEAKTFITQCFDKAKSADDPPVDSVMHHIFAESPVQEESGARCPAGVSEKTVMVDAALHAVDEILKAHPEALFYGQDVGRRLGGVFREAATLAEKYGDERVFNTAIQEAYIIGSTAGMSAVGLKPIVEIQFADYIWPGVNQLVTELSKSCYLSRGQFPVQSLIRIPIGAYGGGGPYHSGCIESSILAVRGIKVCYPSNAADLKGLIKGAFYDPNPVVIFEHKGLYWSKVPGTDDAKTIEPASDYIIPLGKGRIALQAGENCIESGESLCIITYGMGVHWALNASKDYIGQIEIIDLRTLHPLDEQLVMSAVKRHGKCIVLTEEPIENSFAQALAGKIASQCFSYLDNPVCIIGAMPVPAIPLNIGLEKVILPNVDLLKSHINNLLSE